MSSIDTKDPASCRDDLKVRDAARKLEESGFSISEALLKERVISKGCGKLGSTFRVRIPSHIRDLLKTVSKTRYFSNERQAKKFLENTVKEGLHRRGYPKTKVKCGRFFLKARGL